MLKYHLQGRKYGEPSRELMIMAKSTSITNAEAERDLGMLHYFKKLKPKALHLTIGGIIMYSRSKAGSWIKNLPDNKVQEHDGICQKIKKGTERKVFG